MEGFTIEVEPREIFGSSAMRRLRRDGKVPSVIYYSKGAKSYSVTLNSREFVRLAKLAKNSQLFTFKSSLTDLDGRAAIVKEVQQNSLTGELLHIDFQALRDDEEVTVAATVKLTGEARGVKLDGGILTLTLHEVHVRCLPKAIPNEIVLDVSDLGLGHSYKIKDLKALPGVRFMDDPEESVVSVVAVHAIVEETVAATPAEGAAATAGTAAAPAAGATAAAAAPGDKKADSGDKKGAEKKDDKKDAKGK